MCNYKGSLRNRLSVPEVGEAVRGDTERHYKKKRNDSQKSYDKRKKGKYQEKSIGTSFGELLRGIKRE